MKPGTTAQSAMKHVHDAKWAAACQVALRAIPIIAHAERQGLIPKVLLLPLDDYITVVEGHLVGYGDGPAALGLCGLPIRSSADKEITVITDRQAVADDALLEADADESDRMHADMDAHDEARREDR